MNAIMQNKEAHILESNLEVLREQINKADEQLLQILWWRIDVAKRIGDYKKRNGMEVLQPRRWQEVMKTRLAMADALNLNKTFVEELYNLIHKECIQVQEESL